MLDGQTELHVLKIAIAHPEAVSSRLARTRNASRPEAGKKTSSARVAAIAKTIWCMIKTPAWKMETWMEIAVLKRKE
tara:strand:- start:9 stop:239 length:231 start_codon:yes stop_codon:yes gene_type:complete